MCRVTLRQRCCAALSSRAGNDRRHPDLRLPEAENRASFSPSRLLIALSFCSLMALASASVAWSGVLKACCAIADAESMNTTSPLRSLLFMSVPLAMSEFHGVQRVRQMPDAAAAGGRRVVCFAHHAAAAPASSRSGCRFRSARWPGADCFAAEACAAAQVVRSVSLVSALQPGGFLAAAWLRASPSAGWCRSHGSYCVAKSASAVRLRPDAVHIFRRGTRRLWEGFTRRFLHLAQGRLTLAVAVNRFLLC